MKTPKPERPITRTDKLIDHLYDNKKLLIIYFIITIIMSALRYFLIVFFNSFTISGGEILAWSIWAIAYFPALRYLVFKVKSDNIYALFKKLIIYFFCIFAIWLVNQFSLGIVAIATKSPSLALSLGGTLTEIVCLALMWKVVFKK